MAKVLIIEDDPYIIRMYQRLFTLAGYEVNIAIDGQTGIDKAKTIRPSIILLDVMIPKINGLEALKELKSDANIKLIPVIILTNLDGEQEAKIAIKNGASKYIVKGNYEPEQIVTIVKETLAKENPSGL